LVNVLGLYKYDRQSAVTLQQVKHAKCTLTKQMQAYMLFNDGQSSADFTARNSLAVRSLQSDRKRRRSIRKYVPINGLGKQSIAANSCH